jgi:hypothetical protein
VAIGAPISAPTRASPQPSEAEQYEPLKYVTLKQQESDERQREKMLNQRETILLAEEEAQIAAKQQEVGIEARLRKKSSEEKEEDIRWLERKKAEISVQNAKLQAKEETLKQVASGLEQTKREKLQAREAKIVHDTNAVTKEKNLIAQEKTKLEEREREDTRKGLEQQQAEKDEQRKWDRAEKELEVKMKQENIVEMKRKAVGAILAAEEAKIEAEKKALDLALDKSKQEHEQQQQAAGLEQKKRESATEARITSVETKETELEKAAAREASDRKEREARRDRKAKEEADAAKSKAEQNAQREEVERIVDSQKSTAKTRSGLLVIGLLVALVSAIAFALGVSNPGLPYARVAQTQAIYDNEGNMLFTPAHNHSHFKVRRFT